MSQTRPIAAARVMVGVSAPRSVRAAAERRTGPRLPVRIPLLLDWGCGAEESWTITANEGGALVSSPVPLEAGQRVRVFNVTTGLSAIGHVVSPLLSAADLASGTGPGFRLTLRLETLRGRFWGPVYDAARDELRLAS